MHPITLVAIIDVAVTLLAFGFFTCGAVGAYTYTDERAQKQLPWIKASSHGDNYEQELGFGLVGGFATVEIGDADETDTFKYTDDTEKVACDLAAADRDGWDEICWLEENRYMLQALFAVSLALVIIKTVAAGLFFVPALMTKQRIITLVGVVCGFAAFAFATATWTTMLMETYPDEIDDPNPAFPNALSVKLGNGMIFAIVGTGLIFVATFASAFNVKLLSTEGKKVAAEY